MRSLHYVLPEFIGFIGFKENLKNLRINQFYMLINDWKKLRTLKDISVR